MAHCIIWFSKDSHLEINLDYVPQPGQTIQIETDDNTEVSQYLVKEVQTSLIFNKQKWHQLTDISLIPTESHPKV